MVRKRPAPNQTSAAVGSPSDVAKRTKVEDSPSLTKERVASPTNERPQQIPNDHGAMKCIAILPGIGKYTESSDSEKSTDTEEEYDFSAYDWVGRKITRNKCGEWATKNDYIKTNCLTILWTLHSFALLWSWAVFFYVYKIFNKYSLIKSFNSDKN